MAINGTIYILDIDGTLMPTHGIDNDCYWGAVEQVFGLRQEGFDLLDCVHVSDSGILDQWCRHHLGREPTQDETQSLKTLFLDLLENIAREQPELFEPRAGVVDWLERMSSRPGIHLAIATGGWAHTANYKLERSGLARFGLALATADDAVSRADIMTTALERLRLDAPAKPDRITYVGDGPWDLLASQSLGWSFIGIAEGRRAQALRELGAEQVHRDFQTLQTA